MTRISNTLRILQHYQAFLASPCSRMRSPLDRFGFTFLSKEEAAEELRWLVHMAVSRRGGACLPINDSVTGASRNHRGAPCRKESADYQRGLLQDAADLSRSRMRLYFLRTPELRTRFAARITRREA